MTSSKDKLWEIGESSTSSNWPGMEKTQDNYQNKKKTGGSQQSSQNNPNQTDNPWNIIIVNGLPCGIDRDKFESFFSQYGSIHDIYLSTCREFYCPIEYTKREFARITFATEEEAKKVLDAAQHTSLIYDGHVLVITLVSADYCPIEMLPNDCLLEIFFHLTSWEDKFALESVSRRWKELSKDSWSKFTKLANYDRFSTVIPRAKKYLREINMTIEESNYVKYLKMLANCTRIEKIDFYITILLSDTMLRYLYAIFHKNHNLRYINFGFSKPFFEEDEIDCYTKSVNISFGPCGRSLNNSSVFRNLQVLILERIGFHEFSSETFKNMVNLKKLKLYRSFSKPGYISGIAELTELEYLSVPFIGLTDDIFEKVVKNNKKLKHLNVHGNASITDASFKYVQQLPELRVLIIEGLSQVSDKYLTNMSSVRCLDVNGCSLITDRGIKRFFETANNIAWLEIIETGVTLRSISIALEWTKSSGNTLKLFVTGELLYDHHHFEIGDNNGKLIVDTVYDETPSHDEEDAMHYREYAFYEQYGTCTLFDEENN